ELESGGMIGSDEPALAAGEEGEGEVEGEEGVRIRLVPILLLLPRNAQLARLLAWLKEEHNSIYPSALAIVENTCKEFENRVTKG
ncbi:MAG: hypothetical protein ACKO2Z_09680, partial [Sphaerospermopsis kisseleviana]